MTDAIQWFAIIGCWVTLYLLSRVERRYINDNQSSPDAEG